MPSTLQDGSYGYDEMTREQMLTLCEKGWKSGGRETKCGSGSTLERTINVRRELKNLTDRFGIQTIADAGAGDLRWIKLIRHDWNVDYQGFDLYPRHDDVQRLDITTEILPTVDLIICRHVLNHLSVKFAQNAIENFRKSGSKYLLMTLNPKQVEYWKIYEFGEIPKPIHSFQDTGNWWMELSELN